MSKFEIENNNQNRRFERRENIGKLHEFSKATSQEIIQKYGDNIVNKDLTINRGFFDGNTCYTKEEMKEDEKFVEEKKDKFDKEKLKDSNGQLFEEAIACVLYRILKKDYLVVRSSDFDDFHNGVDLLIIDPETNEIVCFVDNITTYNEDLDAIENKESKVLEQNINGGAEIKYGLAFKENEQLHSIELTGEKVKDIPIFPMHLSGEKLDKLLNEMDYDINNDPSETELETFDELMRIIKIDSKEMYEEIQKKSKEDDVKMIKKETELNYLLNVKIKDIEREISKANSKRKKVLINKKRTLEKDIKNLENYIENAPVREKNRITSLTHLERTFNLFEEIKETRNKDFSENK